MCFVSGLSGDFVDLVLSQWCNSFPEMTQTKKHINILEQLKENEEVNLGTLGS
jgi:hypothetical protein